MWRYFLKATEELFFFAFAREFWLCCKHCEIKRKVWLCNKNKRVIIAVTQKSFSLGSTINIFEKVWASQNDLPKKTNTNPTARKYITEIVDEPCKGVGFLLLNIIPIILVIRHLRCEIGRGFERSDSIHPFFLFVWGNYQVPVTVDTSEAPPLHNHILLAARLLSSKQQSFI